MAKTITVSKEEYQRLRRVARRYETIRELVAVDFFAEPATKDVKKIIREFRKTGLYNVPFLKSLERGLEESSYFRVK